MTRGEVNRLLMHGERSGVRELGRGKLPLPSKIRSISVDVERIRDLSPGGEGAYRSYRFAFSRVDEASHLRRLSDFRSNYNSFMTTTI